MQNAIQFLASNAAMGGARSLSPGQPVTLPVPDDAGAIIITRPDGTNDTIPAAGHQMIHYARTRRVGTYRVQPGVEGSAVFAVNLFNATESRVAPAPKLTIGIERVQARAGTIEVNEPAWPYFLVAILALLLLEWVVYNKRVFV